MKIVCLMGDNEIKKDKIKEKLITLGFKPISRYSTYNKNAEYVDKDNKEYNIVTHEQFNRLIDNNNILYYKILDNEVYGIARPYGSTRYVIDVDDKEYNVICDTYRKQVINILITDTIIDNEHTHADILIDNEVEIDNAIVKILKYTKVFGGKK